MGKLQHRDRIIDRIRDIEDKNVIDEIYRLLHIDFEESIYRLQPDQKREIDEAREQIARGEGISSEEVEREFEQWLKRYLDPACNPQTPGDS